jgi:hypothetical protein
VAELFLDRLFKLYFCTSTQDPHVQKEAKTWLITSIAKLNPKTPQQVAAFLSFLPKPRRHESSHSAISKSTEAGLLHQLVLLLCESRSMAPRLARLLSRDTDMVKKFFGKDEGRVETWFRHFAGVVSSYSQSFTALDHSLKTMNDLNKEQAWEAVFAREIYDGLRISS